MEKIQYNLFIIGSNLAALQTDLTKIPKLDQSETENLEKSIDNLNKNLSPLKNFILPGGSTVSACLFRARAICRRTERRIIELDKTMTVPREIIRYTNRLSDYLFVLARFINKHLEADERIWTMLNNCK